MLRRLALVCICIVGGATTLEGQAPRVTALALLQPTAPPAHLEAFSAQQRRAMSTGARTLLWAGIGATTGFVVANITTDEDGIKSAELTGALAGAVTGVVFSLVVLPALWPSKSTPAGP